ncbi:Zinc finger protein MSN4 [Holothuria leucospilota]|uniref:Zinc finger protein MSN4 n=1 Tax=Holothuria leucospilota TaxID=206669 RepID=A0A9Q1H1Z4_HOLLE|nr:Zinc finger protein MSN4 [Holothuria leucospilota]
MNFTDVLDEKELEKSREYRCRVCKERLKSLTQLRDHLRSKHKAERFACQMCTDSSDRKGNVFRHIETTL